MTSCDLSDFALMVVRWGWLIAGVFLGWFIWYRDKQGNKQEMLLVEALILVSIWILIFYLIGEDIRAIISK